MQPGPDLRGATLAARYRLDELVGFGGSGNVYAALDLRLRRDVAVKVIHPYYARDEQQRLRIRQEALLGARLAHEHLAPILDLGEYVSRGDVLPFIVMPLLRGRTLRDLLNQGAVPWQAAACWVHQLLLGLAALHGEGVIHRDVKPENCLLVRERERERLKLIDLGLAKL
ncbi:MAG: protein kinase, partial [Myxococcales bacterium]|nr:protein kinase [Myxococcales bacterium]